MNSFPLPIHPYITEIPFNKFDKDFTWDNFEDLCKDLAKEEFEFKEVRPFGAKGDDQYGIDIYVFNPNEKTYVTLQCKRVKNYNPSKIKTAVDAFLKGDMKDYTSTFILCCTDSLNKGKRQQAIIEQQLRLNNLGYKFYIWDYIGINTLLKKYPKIVGNNFGNQYVKAFNGDIAYNEYIKHYKSTLRPPGIVYEYSGRYLPRKVSKLSDYISINTLPSIESEGKRLLDVISASVNSKNKFILLSQGGYGKSSEVNYLAYYFSTIEQNLFPIKIELRNFIDGEEIEYILNKQCANWEAVPQEELLLLFDGLDEISEKEYVQFIKKANIFSNKNSQIKILITSRTNFFNGTKGSNLFDGFEILMLNDLTSEEILDYINSALESNTTAFERIIFKSNLLSLFVSPFYLTATVNLYKETLATKEFPTTKAAIINAIIQKQFEQANKKFAASEFDSESNKTHLNSLLNYIAFSMTRLGRNNLLLEELRYLIPNENDRKILKFSILEFVNEKYQFSHNLIQEFLTAEYLTNLKFDTIKDLVAFNPEYVRVKNKWLNSLSFLLSSNNITKELIRNLIDWISEIQPELLIKNMESNKFSKDLRYSIAVSTIKKYQEKKIHFPIGEFSVYDLINFCGKTKPMFTFCIDLLKQSETVFETKLVAARILNVFDNFYGKEKETKDLFINCILENVEFPILQQQAAITLITLSRNGFTAGDVFEWFLYIKNKVKNVSNPDLRNGLLRLIATQEIKIEYFDFAVESIYTLNNDSERISHLHEEKPIEEVLLKSSKPEFVSKIFELIISDKTLLREERYKSISFGKEFISKLIDNAITAYQEEKNIFHLVICFIERLKYRYQDYQYSSVINPFFEKTKTKSKAFNYFYIKAKSFNQQTFWYDIEKMLLFADKLNLKKVFRDYQNDQSLKNLLISCRNTLKYEKFNTSINLYDWFYNYINSLSDNEFFIDEKEIFDWNKHRLNQQARDQEILIDKDLFYKEVTKVFAKAGKSALTKDEIWDYNKNYLQDEGTINNTLVLPLLRAWAEKKGYVDALAIYTGFVANETKWANYVIREVAQMLSSNNKAIVINDSLKNFVIFHILKKLEKVNLKHAITDTPNGHRFTLFADYLNTFINNWDIEIPENHLLDLLYIDHWGVYYEEKENRPIHFVIRKVKDKSKIKERVLANLNDSTLSRNVISAQFALCKLLEISEAKNFLYIELTGIKFSIYEKQKFFEIYIHLGGESSDLLEEYIYYKNVDYWFWDMTDHLITEYPNEVFSQIISILKSDKTPKEDKISASLRLLKLGKYEGIEYFCKYVRQYLNTPYDYYFTSQLSSAIVFPYKKSLDILFETLLLFFSDKEIYLKQKTFERVDDTIYSLIFIVALQSDESYLYAVQKYNSFYNKHKSKSVFLNHIFYSLDRLQNQYYIKMEDMVDITDLKPFTY